MSILRFNITMSLDGYVAGPNQSVEHPLGEGGEKLHEWAFASRAFRKMLEMDGGEAGPDDAIIDETFRNLGATIMGRNMFGPIRGPWPDESWKGWWGPNPPYHVPVFVLTHHARPPIEMEGGTVFHFVTDGIESALARAKQVAGARDIRIGGGASVIRQYLQARLIDEVRLAVAPVFVGAGENLFSGLNLPDLGYACVESTAGANATHVRAVRQSS
jgi:dihydrofolate reductase